MSIYDRDTTAANVVRTIAKAAGDDYTLLRPRMRGWDARSRAVVDSVEEQARNRVGQALLLISDVGWSNAYTRLDDEAGEAIVTVTLTDYGLERTNPAELAAKLRDCLTPGPLMVRVTLDRSVDVHYAAQR